MKTIKTNNDLRVGMVLTCANGKKYVVVADDNGHHDVISISTHAYSNGSEVGTDKIAVVGGINGSRDVVKIEEFDTLPTRNRLSEALKFITKQPFTATLLTVWKKESHEVLKAREALERAKEALAKAEEDYDALIGVYSDI